MPCDGARQKQKEARQEVILNKTREEKDLGMVIQDILSSERHISILFGSTLRISTKIRVAFHYMD